MLLYLSLTFSVLPWAISSGVLHTLLFYSVQQSEDLSPHKTSENQRWSLSEKIKKIHTFYNYLHPLTLSGAVITVAKHLFFSHRPLNIGKV